MIGTYAMKKLRYDQLFIDRSLPVQRSLNQSHANHIAQNFNPDAVGTLIVSHRDNDSYHVIDGQTRRAGAMAAGYGETLVDCQVYEGLTRAQEAALFRQHNDRRSVGPIDKFLVRVTEREPVAVDIHDLLLRSGWTVANARNNGKVQAVGALEQVYRLGEKVDRDTALHIVAMVVSMITEAYGKDPDGMRSEIVSGLGLLVATHYPGIDTPKLVREMSQYEGGPLALVGRCKGLREMRGGKIADNMADVLVNLHNKQKRHSKLPTWRAD